MTPIKVGAPKFTLISPVGMIPVALHDDCSGGLMLEAEGEPGILQCENCLKRAAVSDATNTDVSYVIETIQIEDETVLNFRSTLSLDDRPGYAG